MQEARRAAAEAAPGAGKSAVDEFTPITYNVGAIWERNGCHWQPLPTAIPCNQLGTHGRATCLQSMSRPHYRCPLTLILIYALSRPVLLALQYSFFHFIFALASMYLASK